MRTSPTEQAIIHGDGEKLVGGPELGHASFLRTLLTLPAPFCPQSGPKNTSNLHYAGACVSLTGSLLCGYAAYAGIGFSPKLPPAYFVNFATFVVCAFGFAFLAVPNILLPTKSRFRTGFDDNHAFIARFCGFSMLVIGYHLYAVLGTSDAFKAGAIWTCGAGLLGPTYASLYLDAIMTPEGLGGDFFIILIAGVLAGAATF